MNITKKLLRELIVSFRVHKNAYQNSESFNATYDLVQIAKTEAYGEVIASIIAKAKKDLGVIVLFKAEVRIHTEKILKLAPDVFEYKCDNVDFPQGSYAWLRQGYGNYITPETIKSATEELVSTLEDTGNYIVIDEKAIEVN